MNDISTTSSAAAKPGLDVADLELDALRDVRGLGRRRLDAARDHVFEQQRRVGLHRLVDVDDVRQHLVVDLDQRERLVGDRLADRRDGRDRVAFIEDLLARHDVARHVPEILRDALGADVFEFLVGEVLGGDHRLDAGQRLCFRGVDRADARMRVGRAQMRPSSMPGIAKSAPYCARPVTFGTPSGRIGRVPTHLKPLVSGAATSFTAVSSRT